MDLCVYVCVCSFIFECLFLLNVGGWERPTRRERMWDPKEGRKGDQKKKKNEGNKKKSKRNGESKFENKIVGKWWWWEDKAM